MTIAPSLTGGAPVPSISVPAVMTRGASTSATIRRPPSPPSSCLYPQRRASAECAGAVACQEPLVEGQAEARPVGELHPPPDDAEVLVEVTPDGGRLVRRGSWHGHPVRHCGHQVGAEFGDAGAVRGELDVVRLGQR